MFGIPSPWKYGCAGLAIALAVASAWGFRVDHLRGLHLRDLNTMTQEAQTVVVALRTASGNDRTAWSNAPAQILALGDEKRQWQETSHIQSEAIDEMAAKGVALRARAAELQQIADAARAKRQAALSRLNDMALTPGQRADCELLLREANEALDLVYRESL